MRTVAGMIVGSVLAVGLLGAGAAPARSGEGGAAAGCRTLPQDAVQGGRHRQPTEAEVARRLADACGTSGADAERARDRTLGGTPRGPAAGEGPAAAPSRP